MPATISPVEALDDFFRDGLITDLLYQVKSGKEAAVYCCEADPRMGVTYFAAKVYHERNQRDFKNDAVYREGRPILDKRLRKAAEKKSRKGREFLFGSWIHREWETLGLLHRVSADVPRPVACAENAILMEFIGDETRPAVQLNTVRPEPEEARRLFGRVLWNIELWLTHDRVHGDLSPYNILYRPGGITVIDFPQAFDPRFNPNAYDLLNRDIDNVYRYFSRLGVEANPTRIADNLWGRFRRSEL